MLSADTVCSRRVRQKLKWAVAAEQGCLVKVVRAGPEAPFPVSQLPASPSCRHWGGGGHTCPSPQRAPVGKS